MSRSLPYVWRRHPAAPASLKDLVQSEKDTLDALLLEHGAALFKGFGIGSAQAFEHVVDALAPVKAAYIDGNSPRTKLSDSVYTSTEYPADLKISLHNELSYSPRWPARLYFCCVEPALTGGSTLIADSAAILRALPARLVDEFERRGVRYVRNLHGGRGARIGKSWQETFETTSRDSVEAFCRQGRIAFEWKADGGLRLIQTGPATARHPRTGEKVWFNQLEQFHPSSNPPDVYEALQELFGDTPEEMPQYASFGDGTPVPGAMLADIRTAMDQQTVVFPWEHGDLMIIDNMLTAHGRAPFTGPRKILVSMSS